MNQIPLSPLRMSSLVVVHCIVDDSVRAEIEYVSIPICLLAFPESYD